MNQVLEHVDVLIVGAGISGISAAVHLQQRCPSKTFTILERRPRIGGTWDLFRYPGVRSDSDMYTLGFRFKPWTKPKAIADGPSILEYLHETVAEHHLIDKIHFEHRVTRASWSSETARWTVELSVGADSTSRTIECQFMFICGGYYNYDQGYTPNFAGRSDFRGQIVHPQHWPADLITDKKRIVVIGSGATAVTLVPALVKDGAEHVTMLQRSPTYVVSRPAEDKVANKLRELISPKMAYTIIRWRNVLLGSFFYNLTRKRPDKIKEKLLTGVRAELGPDYDVATHFTPRYNPWDQRLCLVPDSDLFTVIRDKKASVATAEIDCFTATGIKLKTGEELPADIIVTATGLNLQMLGGIEMIVDAKPVEPGETVLHKGVLLSGLPNLAMWFGYVNASWTLKADLTSEYLCRILQHLDTTGNQIFRADASMSVASDNFVNFEAGYFQRSQHLLPKQGTELPWRLHQNYLKDLRLLRHGPIEAEGLTFEKPRRVRIPL